MKLKTTTIECMLLGVIKTILPYSKKKKFIVTCKYFFNISWLWLSDYELRWKGMKLVTLWKIEKLIAQCDAFLCDDF